MFVARLFVSIQHSSVRFKTRKKLAFLTAQQMWDLGLTKEQQQAELSQATMAGFMSDLRVSLKNKGRIL